MGLLVLIILVVLCTGAWPGWGYHSLGYGPSGFLGLILIIVLILVLTGYW